MIGMLVCWELKLLSLTEPETSSFPVDRSVDYKIGVYRVTRNVKE